MVVPAFIELALSNFRQSIGGAPGSSPGRSLTRSSSPPGEEEREVSDTSRRMYQERPITTRSHAGALSTLLFDNDSQIAEFGREQENVELRTELEFEKQKNAQLVTELAENTQAYQELNGRLGTHAEKMTAMKKRLNHNVEWKDRYKSELSEARKATKQMEIRNSKLESLATKTSKKHQQSIAELTQKAQSLDSKKIALENQINQLQHETETQKSNITELTGSILQSSIITTLSRDDDYFAGEFARLTGAIRQWVLRYFHPFDVPELNYGDLSETLARVLAKTILASTSSSITSDSKIKIGRKDVEAAIAYMLTDNILKPAFFFLLSGWPVTVPEDFPEVSDLETQKWHSQTTSMLIQHRDFESRLANHLDLITGEIQQCFPAHVIPGIEEPGFRVLRGIVEQAARLKIDISREVSMFDMPYITPGSSYIMDQLDDRSGTVDGDDDDSDTEEEEEVVTVEGKTEETDMQPGNGKESVNETEMMEEVPPKLQKKKEKKRKEFIVDAVLFPPVVRLEFDDKGKFTTSPITIRKGVVTAIRA